MTTILDAMKMALAVLESLDFAEFDQQAEDAITALSQAIEQMESAEPNYVQLLKDATATIRSKPVYKRFVDGTPLDNDIAVWMADFAISYTHPTSAPDATKWQLVLKDAERYRYLRHASRRECLDKNGPKAGCWIDCEDEYHTLILLTEEDADEAIDKAMLSAAPKMSEDV